MEDYFEIGEPVEVHSTFCADWASGFVVAEITDTGYRVKRLADQYVLPGTFSTRMLRRVGRLVTI